MYYGRRDSTPCRAEKEIRAQYLSKSEANIFRTADCAALAVQKDHGSTQVLSRGGLHPLKWQARQHSLQSRKKLSVRCGRRDEVRGINSDMRGVVESEDIKGTLIKVPYVI
jgi:hypothetical protein